MSKLITIIICSCLILGVTICYADTKLISGELTTNNKSPLMFDIASLENNYSSPEMTWSLFTKALMNGDYESAKDCYCSSNKKNIDLFKKFGASKTKLIIRQMKSFDKVFQDNKKAKYVVVRDMQGVDFSTYVYFARINNEWKIEKY